MLLRNLDIRENYKKLCDCHTCFVKLPLVTLFIVLVVVFSNANT